MTGTKPEYSGVKLVCPVCRGPLRFASDIHCLNCGKQYAYENGFPDLIVGGRFEDEDDAERTAYEENCNEYTARNYLLPSFQRLFTRIRRTSATVERPRLLSLGCGTGKDVDLLNESGFEVFGIDCGNRCNVWPHRVHADRLYLANGKHLPFEDRSFDLVYCGCVFPHIGVDGDSTRVLPEYFEERLAIAREMTRVLRPGGHILVSSPNRWFPLDIFHGRTPENPYPRLNPPTNPFLLSSGDYRRLFGRAGCNDFQLLPVTGYWGFIRMKQRWKGRLLSIPVETVFEAVSWRPLSFLRGSVVNPWLVMLARKPAQ